MKFFKVLAIGFLGLTILSCSNKRMTNKSLDTKIDSVSYALGMDMAFKIKTNFGDLNADLFVQGYLNGVDSTGLLLKNEDLKIITAYFQQRKIDAINKKQANSLKDLEKKFGPNKKAGEEFIAYNKDRPGVLATKSGLQYIILKEGTGAKPKADSYVKVHYTGKLINGTVFESSRKNKNPSGFYVNQVIAGWTEGLQLMKVGAKYRFFISQELAYGQTYKSKLIQPFTALVFDLELIEITEIKK